MKKIKDILRSPVTTIAAFGLAAGLLLFSSIGGARAALTYFSEIYRSRYGMYDIGVTLVETNGKTSKDVSWRNFLRNIPNRKDRDNMWVATNETYSMKKPLDSFYEEEPKVLGSLMTSMVISGEDFEPGKVYDEALSVRNSGNENGVDEYVRVTIYKYWEDADGNRMTELTPDMIDLHLTNLNSDWLEDKSASTTERTVLYYNKKLANGSTTKPFSDTLTIDEKFATTVSQEVETVTGGKEITTTYVYDGVKFYVYVVVDAIQDHNAKDAIKSAWGRNVTVNENAGTLALN